MSSTDLGSFEWPPGGAGGGGGGSGSLNAAGNVALGSGVSSAIVTYGSPFLSLAYALVFSFQNTTDASPIFLQGIITAFSTTGFTITFNAPTDSANYVLNYMAGLTL